MKFTSTSFEFNTFSDFKRFVLDYNFLNSTSLLEPISDNAGNVLIKEKIRIKESMLRKLEELDREYVQTFKVELNKEIVKLIRENLCKAILEIPKSKSNELLHFLFQEGNVSLRVKGIIKNAFYTKGLAIAFFRIYLERPTFFAHIATNALLALGVVLQKNYGIRMINRHSFLTGLFYDISLIDTDYWKSSLFGTEIKNVAKYSLLLAQKWNMNATILDAIGNHKLNDLKVDENDARAEYNLDGLGEGILFNELRLMDLTMDEELEDEEEEGAAAEDDLDLIPEDNYNASGATVATEAGRISRYISENLKSTSDKNNLAEKLLILFVYNVERGLFLKEVADPMIKAFKKFDHVIRKIRLIAQVEADCKFPPSAWAYPKPNASQILCKNREYTCPHLVSGWDIHVTSYQNGYGFVGTSLNIGSYPKCNLEETLREKMDNLDPG